MSFPDAFRTLASQGNASDIVLRFVHGGAPYVEALRGHRALSAALSAVTAAVTGVVLNLAIWFAVHLLFAEVRPLRSWGLNLDVPVPSSLDPWALVLSAAAALAVLRFKVGVIPVLIASALAGAAVHLLGAR